MGDGRGILAHESESKIKMNQTQQSNGVSKPKWRVKEREQDQDSSKGGNLQPRNTVSQMDCQRILTIPWSLVLGPWSFLVIDAK
jgi:hypothetical protein